MAPTTRRQTRRSLAVSTGPHGSGSDLSANISPSSTASFAVVIESKPSSPTVASTPVHTLSQSQTVTAIETTNENTRVRSPAPAEEAPTEEVPEEEAPTEEVLEEETPAQPNGVKTNGVANGHVRYDSDDEDEGEEEVGDTTIMQFERQLDAEQETAPPLPPAPRAVEVDDEDDEEDSDDEAPEAVSISTSKTAAQKREEEAKLAREAQEASTREKRKRRDTQLKEQKAQSKRRKLDVPEEKAETETSAPAEEGGDTPADNDEEEPTNTALVPTKKPEKSKLLPTELLEALAARSTKRDASPTSDDEEDSDDGLPPVVVPASKTAKNKRRKLAKQARKEFKRGAVTVKVMQDDSRLKKVLPPPGRKSVMNQKEAWLRQTGVRAKDGGGTRKPIGGGLGMGLMGRL